MSRTAMLWVSIGVVLVTIRMQATIFDNRFIPFLQRPYIVHPDRYDHVNIDVFFATARQSLGVSDTEIGLPQIYGQYNQASVGKAFVAIGQDNPLPSRFQNAKINWQQEGKLMAQGFEISVQKRLSESLFLGIYTYFMRVDTVSAFFLNKNDSDGFVFSEDANRLLLERIRLQMNRQACLTSGDHAKQFGFGDMDVYLMLQHYWQYCLKFRSIRAQLRAGVLVPSGVKRNINEPTSIPFGGDGFWGAYVATEGEFELKEDWKVGGFLWASKRFRATHCERIPLCEVPYPYSPLVAQVDTNPGATFVGMVWVGFEELHKGLGARLLLTVRRHLADSWHVPTLPNITDKACDMIKNLTDWGSDYITLNVLYDFSKVKADDEGKPIVYFAWDIPSNMLVARNVFKTFKFILGAEFNF